MITHNLTLDYKLSAGWLAPWVDGLADGRAMARKCVACGQVSFVPLRVCGCGSDDGIWLELSGRAKILQRTSGADGEYCLAKFHGADIACVAQLRQFTPQITQGCLVPSEKNVPMLILEPVNEEGEN